MKWLFLDIDGVLNTHKFCEIAQSNTIDKDKVERLNRILERTDARIVLTSAWRYLVHRGEMDIRGLDWLLRSHGVKADSIVGITGRDSTICGKPWPNERGRQVTDYFNQSSCWPKVDKYVVIDDLDLGISEAKHPLVLTNGAVGLTDTDADRAISLLGG